MDKWFTFYYYLYLKTEVEEENFPIEKDFTVTRFSHSS